MPSGGLEPHETLEECCVREVKEETGYDVTVLKEVECKKLIIEQIDVTTYYYAVALVEEIPCLAIDDAIEAVRWVPIDSIESFIHLYPEDIKLIRKWEKLLRKDH